MAKANIKKQTISNDNEFGKLIKIVLILVILFLAFYLLTIFLNKEEKPEEKEPTNTSTIQYDKILVGNILEQPNDKYYVLVEHSEDKNIGIYEAYLANYKSQTDALRVYYARLDLPYNQKFISDKNVTNVTKIDDLRLKGTVLLQIEKGKIVKTWDGKDNIKKYLEELTKTEEEAK